MGKSSSTSAKSAKTMTTARNLSNGSNTNTNGNSNVPKTKSDTITESETAAKNDTPAHVTYPHALDSLDDVRGAKLLLDTNVVVDFLGRREPHFEKTKLLMTAGRLHEFQLWISATQITDLLYILSDGGKQKLLPRVAEAVDGLLDFVSVFATGQDEAKNALRSGWLDPEDALIYQAALKLHAAAIITRNAGDFAKSLVPVYDCEEFFEALHDRGLDYGEIDF